MRAEPSTPGRRRQPSKESKRLAWTNSLASKHWSDFALIYRVIAGHVLRREFEYIRHGALSWFFNLDVVTGQVIEPSWGSTRNEVDCLAHLQRLIRSDATATKWHLLVDNLNIHQSELLALLSLQR